MTSTNEEFPSPEDIRTHKRARTLQEKEKIELTRRANEITNPQELVDFVFEIATKKYRRGERKMNFSFEVPTDNFRAWAATARVGSQDWDILDHRMMKQEVTRMARIALKRRLAHGVFLTLRSGFIGDARLNFSIELSVIRPS